MTSQTTETLTLTPPEPIAAIEPEQAYAMVKLEDEQKNSLDERVKEFVTAIISHNIGSDDFKQQIDAVHAMGN